MAQRNSGYDRKERECYETPEWVTAVLARYLLRYEARHGADRFRILEPAAGSGKMVRELRRRGFRRIFASDVHPQPGLDAVVRFQELALRIERQRPEERPDLTATNPPYNEAEEFIETALRVMSPSTGLVAMLLKVDFDSGKTRRHVFGDHPGWGTKIVLLDRITWFEPPPGTKKTGPSENHAWFVWNWRKVRKHAPEVIYAGRGEELAA